MRGRFNGSLEGLIDPRPPQRSSWVPCKGLHAAPTLHTLDFPRVHATSEVHVPCGSSAQSTGRSPCFQENVYIQVQKQDTTRLSVYEESKGAIPQPNQSPSIAGSCPVAREIHELHPCTPRARTTASLLVQL